MLIAKRYTYALYQTFTSILSQRRQKTKKPLLTAHFLIFSIDISRPHSLCGLEKKIYVLDNICNYMDAKKRRTFMKIFITSHCSSAYCHMFCSVAYCPVVWIIHSRNMEHRPNKIHLRALQLAHENSCDLIFEELLVKEHSVSVLQKNPSCNWKFQAKNWNITWNNERNLSFWRKTQTLQIILR